MADTQAERDHERIESEIPLLRGLGRRIRSARLARAMRLADVAGSDFSPSFLSLVEQGKSGLSLRSLGVIARRLDLPLSYFFEAEPGVVEVAQLTLDRAEGDLSRDDPDACLRRLDRLNLPELLRTRAHWLRGRALAAIGNVQEALTMFQEALSLAELREEHDLVAHLRYGIVQALVALRSYDEALVAARRALEVALAEPVDSLLAGRVLLTLGHLLFSMNRSDEAVRHYRHASEILKGSGDLAVLGALHADLSEARETSGDIRGAARYARSSATLLAISSDAHFIAREHCKLAGNYLRLGDVDEAHAAATWALAQAQRFRARDVEAHSRSILAMILLQRGDLPAAAESAQVAQVLARDDRDLARIDSWVTLGEIAEHSDASGEADELFSRALASCREAGYQSRFAEICVAYSRLLQIRGETDRALQIALLGAQAQSL